MLSTPSSDQSPKWSWATKLIVGLCFVAVFGWLFTRFRDYLGPLIVASILTYLMYPLARTLCAKLKLSWRASVTILYLLLIVVVLGLLTWGGLALLEQGQSLFNTIQQAATITIPNTIESLSTQVFQIGNYRIEMSQYIQNITDQVLAAVQPLLGQVGTLLTKIATGAAGLLGLIFFIVLISYFITAESGGNLEGSLELEIPGYSKDFRRLLQNINRIWNTFLRGQLILFILTIIIYAILLTALGVRYSLGIAILTGFGRFLPYVGPAISWTTVGLVAYFQGHTIFWLSPLVYVIVVIGLSMVVDSIFDNFVSPKFLGSTLKVHPAAVLVTALIAANVIGFVGVVVAAPVLATLQLLARYALRKMFDLDPWAGNELPDPETGARYIPVWANQAWVRFRANFQQPAEPTVNPTDEAVKEGKIEN